MECAWRGAVLFDVGLVCWCGGGRGWAQRVPEVVVIVRRGLCIWSSVVVMGVESEELRERGADCLV